jgi:hypothetical protein
MLHLHYIPQWIVRILNPAAQWCLNNYVNVITFERRDVSKPHDLLRDFLAVFLPVFLPVFFAGVLPVFFAGTFAPLLRASERPIAIACLRLVTFFPLRPLLSVPLLRSRIAFSTLRSAVFPYFAIGSRVVYKHCT